MWTRFLKSLETEGGKVMIIIFMLMFLMFIVMLMLFTGKAVGESGKLELTGAISSLLAILYGYLKAGASLAPPTEKQEEKK